MNTHLARCWLLLLALAALAACTDAGKCARGELGCACLDNDCSGSAHCEDGMCVSGSAQTQQDSGVPIRDLACTDATFAKACDAFCAAICSNQAELCVKSRCNPSDCGTNACTELCDDDPSCLKTICESQKKLTCQDFGAVDKASGVFQSSCFDKDPACVVSSDLGCSDTCGSLSNRSGGQYANNDKCEDGAKDSVATVRCARGTDCSDCGPRGCDEPLSPCSGHVDCCGWRPSNPAAKCTEVGPGKICLSTCSDDNPCKGDLICTPLQDGSGSVCAP